MSWKGFCLVVLAVVFLAPAQAEYPPAGMDEFDSSARVEIDLRPSGGPELKITADGRTRIMRSGPIEDTGDGRSAIETEIVSLSLTSDTPIGLIEIRESPTRTSAGIVQQQEPGTDFLADSFFDIFVEIETPVGVLHNETAIRLNSVIDALPPLQAEYIPKDTFVGVDLFNASGQRVGIIRHASHYVGQRPSFTVAPRMDGLLRAADLLDPATAVRIPLEMLGLVPGDDVDGLSYGTAFINDWVMDLRFSVDPMSIGSGAVLVESQKGEAHGDEFMALKGGSTNTQIFDENGDTAPPFPLDLIDDVDSLALSPTSFVDPGGDGTPDRSVYFSLGPGSTSLGTLGVTPGDILESSGGVTPRKSYGFEELGLEATDDVDAFCLDVSTNTIVFSLARSSPSLGGTFSPADLFIAAPPFNSALRVFAPASELGLLESDNLNALKCIPAEVDYYPFVRGRVSLNGAPLDLTGTAIVHVGVGPEGETPHDNPNPTSADGVPIEIVELNLQGVSPLVGPIDVKRRHESMFPHQKSRGVLFEAMGQTPEILDIPPFTTEGGGVIQGEFFLEANSAAFSGLHHPPGIPIFGEITHKPLAPGDILQSSGITELFLEGGIQVGVHVSDMSLEFNGDLPPELDIGVNSGGVVRSTDYGRGVARNSIVTLFGQNLLAESETGPPATMLRAVDGETTVTIRDSEGNESIAEQFAIASTQINLLFGSDLANGPAIVTVTRADGRNASGSVQILDAAPGLFSANFTGSGVAAALFLRVAADNTRTSDLIFDPGTLASIPLDLSPEGDAVYLLLYGSGFRDGTDFSATVGGESTAVLGAVAQGQFDGLDQANIGPLSRELIGRGDVDIEFTTDGTTANIVRVNIQ